MRKLYPQNSLSLFLLAWLVLALGACGVSSGGGSGIVAQGSTGGWFSLRLFPDQGGWAQTYDGLLHTSDGGKSWRYVTPWGSAHQGELEADFVNSQVAWLVVPGNVVYQKIGQSNTPQLARAYSTKDGGVTWQHADIPDTAGTYRDALSGAGALSGLFSPSQSYGETRDQISVQGLTATDGLHAWLTVTDTRTHTGGGEESITPVDTRIWQSVDGGKSWTRLVDDKVDASGKLRFSGTWITFLNSTTGFTSGPTPTTILKSTNGGWSWQEQSLPTQKLTPQQSLQPSQAVFFDTRNGIIPMQLLSYPTGSSIFQYVTHDGGQSWQRNSVHQLDKNSANAGFYLDEQRWIWADSQSSLLITEDSDAHLNTVPLPTGYKQMSSLTAGLNEHEVWGIGGVGSKNYADNNSTVLLKSENDGKTWAKVQYTIQS